MIQLAQQILPEFFTLHGAHIQKVLKSLGAHRAHVPAQLLLVHLRCAHGQNIRQVGQRFHRRGIFYVQCVAQQAQRTAVAAGQLQVHIHHLLLGAAALHLQAQFHLAAADGCPQHLFQAVVQKGTASGQAGRILKIAGVHALDLHRNVPAVQHGLGPSVAGHTQRHKCFPSPRSPKARSSGRLRPWLFRRLIPPLRMAAEIDFTYIFNNTIIPLLLQAKDADFRRFARIFSCLLKFFPQDAATACHL